MTRGGGVKRIRCCGEAKAGCGGYYYYYYYYYYFATTDVGGSPAIWGALAGGPEARAALPIGFFR